MKKPYKVPPKGGKKSKTHIMKAKKMGSGKDGRSGSTKLERKLEEESL